MTLDSRSVHVLHLFINADNPLTIQKLTGLLNISRRTVYYDIQKINDWLNEHRMPGVQQQKQKGYFLSQEQKANIPPLLGNLGDWQYFHGKEDRLVMIAVSLLTTTKGLYLQDFIELTNVSRGTVAGDLKELKENWQKKFHLTLEFTRTDGYLVQGKETDKRQALAHYITQLIASRELDQITAKVNQLIFSASQSHGFFDESRIGFLKNVIANCEAMLGTELTDETLELLALQLIILEQRISQGSKVVIDNVEKEALIKTKEYQAAARIATYLQVPASDGIPEDEIYFITINLLGARVNHTDLQMVRSEEMHELKKVIRLMIDDFQKFACIIFQHKQHLEDVLFTHLKPAYYRIKYNVQMENELTKSIQEGYPEIYRLTDKVIPRLEALLKKKVSENEIAYLAVHFGGWLKKEGKKPLPRKKALVVCPNGVGTSTILRMQLEELITTIDIVASVSVRQFYQKSYDVDIIFSTTDIPAENQTVFIVNPILDEAEKESLLKQFNLLTSMKQTKNIRSVPDLMAIIKKHTEIIDEQALRKELANHFQLENPEEIKEQKKPMLKDLLTEEMIQLADHVDNWEEAIQLASRPLLEKDYITEGYIKAMITDIKELGPYIVIAPKIAIPHSRPENGVNELGMSALILQESVKFSEKDKHQANLLFVLAAVDNETHLKALAQLTNMLSEEANVNYLIQTSSKQDVLELVDRYSNHLKMEENIL